MDLAKAIRSSLELWQNPGFGELPPETVVNVANRCVSERFLDLDLTPDACFATVKSDSFVFGGANTREYLLTSPDDISRILRVESRGTGSTSDDDWEEIRIASYENWNDVTERGDGSFCAFYGSPSNLTLVVNRDMSGDEVRIVYKQLATRIETTQDMVDLPDVYETVLIYDMALAYSELIDNQSAEFYERKKWKVPYLESELAKAEARVNKWRKSQKGTSITHRRSFADRQSAVKTGARKFTVQF